MEVERLINRHKNFVYRQMVRVCGNYDDAQDALANAIYSALKASEQLRDPASFQGWLSRIGTRACSRMRIRERLVKLSSLEDLQNKGFDLAAANDSEHEVEAAELKECVIGAIELLPESLREVYLRREISGQSALEVSAALGISVLAVKARLHRARARVREYLDSGLGCATLME